VNGGFGLFRLRWACVNRLLAKLSYGVLNIRQGLESPKRIVDIDAYVDLIRRLQTPNYEHARIGYLSGDHEIEDQNEISPYLQEVMTRTVADQDNH
jgi:hypothetical protein